MTSDPHQTVLPKNPRLGVSVAAEENVTVITVRGELDLATSPRLEHLLSGIGRFTGDLALDLSGVQFVDVSGLRPILRLQDRMERNRERLVVRRVSPAVQRLVDLLPIRLPVEPSLRRGG